MKTNTNKTKAKAKVIKRVYAKACIQFTFRGVLYKIGDSFKGEQKEENSLIIKNFIKWQ